MKRISLALCACLSGMGCGETPTSREAATADVHVQAPHTTRLPADLAIIEKPLTEPLTADEVLCFIDLVKSLPEGKPPEFSPVSAAAKVQGLRLDAAIVAWREAVQNGLTVDTLMKGWNPRSEVRRAINEKQIPPRALSSLMLRLSCSLGVEAMGGRRSVAAQRVIADEKIDALIARIQQINRSGQPIPDACWEGLEEATSLAEYLAVLTTVPPENMQLVAEHKDQLQAILPMPSTHSTPTESHEDHHIVPVHFEEPTRPATPARKSTGKSRR